MAPSLRDARTPIDFMNAGLAIIKDLDAMYPPGSGSKGPPSAGYTLLLLSAIEDASVSLLDDASATSTMSSRSVVDPSRSASNPVVCKKSTSCCMAG